MLLAPRGPVHKEVNVKRTQSALCALGTAVLALTVGLAPAFAQAQAPPPQPEQRQAQPARDPAPVTGDLVTVDTAAKSITVKLANGNEEKFTYNDTTEISGAKDGAAGLATMKEGRVTVHFKDDSASRSKLATRIIVLPKAQ
jgi:hypothetical protein